MRDRLSLSRSIMEAKAAGRAEGGRENYSGVGPPTGANDRYAKNRN